MHITKVDLRPTFAKNHIKTTQRNKMIKLCIDKHLLFLSFNL